MAINWGGWADNLRIGLDIWTDGYDTWTPSINIYVAVHLQVAASYNFNDSQTVHLRVNSSMFGPLSEGSRDVTFQNTLANGASKHIVTATITNNAQNYNGGPTYTFAADMSGVFSGAGPSHIVNFVLPPRPPRAPAPPRSAPVASSIQDDQAYLAWGTTTDGGGSGLIEDRIQVATDSGFSQVVHLSYVQGASAKTVTGLPPGKKLYARAAVRNGIGWSGWSATGTFTTKTRVASAPGTPSYSGATATSVVAAWADSSDYGGASPTGYRLQLSTNSGFTAIAYDSTQNNRTRTASGLKPGTTYWGRVLTVNSAGNSSWSGVRSFTTAIRATSAPGKPTFSNVTPTGMTVSWTAPTDLGGSAVTSYRLQLSTSSTFSSIAYDSSANNRSRAVSGLTPGSAYYARVLAVNGAGNSAWSGVASTGTGVVPPTTPGTPVWADVTPTTASLAWADSSNYGGASPTGYRLVLATDEDFAEVVHDSTATARTRTVSGLAPGTRYYAQVLTENEAGDSPWSGSSTAVTGEFVTPGIAASSIGPDSATISWVTPAGATVTGYEVQYATSADFTADPQTVAEETWANSQVLTGLAPATGYWARVRSATASGYGAWSSAVSFQTLSGAKVRVNGEWVDAVAYVRQSGAWVIAQVHKRKNGAWVV